MAKLRNLDKIFTLSEGGRMTVGNNRTIEKQGARYVCRLHGHAVADIGLGSGGEAFITLNDCGYRTQTTAQTMADFASAFGAKLGVSIAGGELGLRWNYGGEWRDRKAIDGRASIVADRYPA